ncbi:MAG: hypothetical protein F4X17_14970 [Gemmatimonadetes bacterium]|nr:hypothetical protein [Gemmatimonadota bacterium]
MNRISGALGGFARFAFSPAGAIAGATGIAAAVGRMTGNYISSATEINRMTRSTGANAREVSRLLYAWRSLGLEGDDLDSVLVELNNRQGEVLRGNEDLARSFRDVGVSADDIRTGNVSDIFTQVIDGLQQIENHSERTNLVDAIFGGDDGRRILPLLQEGSGRIRELGDEAERYGLVVDQSSAKAAEAWQHNLNIISSVAEGVGNRVGESVVSWTTPLVEQLPEAAQNVINLIDGIGTASGNLSEAFGGLGDTTDDVFDRIRAQIEATRGEAAALANLITTELISNSELRTLTERYSEPYYDPSRPGELQRRSYQESYQLAVQTINARENPVTFRGTDSDYDYSSPSLTNVAGPPGGVNQAYRGRQYAEGEAESLIARAVALEVAGVTREIFGDLSLLSNQELLQALLDLTEAINRRTLELFPVAAQTRADAILGNTGGLSAGQRARFLGANTNIGGAFTPADTIAAPLGNAGQPVTVDFSDRFVGAGGGLRVDAMGIAQAISDHSKANPVSVFLVGIADVAQNRRAAEFSFNPAGQLENQQFSDYLAGLRQFGKI